MLRGASLVNVPVGSASVLALLLVPGSQILVYPLLWILLPKEQPGEQTRPFPVAGGSVSPA